jgi:predicted ABC-type ATPase
LLQGALEVAEFVDADVVARGLSAFNPERVALEAGRMMLRRLHELARQRETFAFETTLASRSFAPWIRRLIDGGYECHILFLWLPSAEFAIQRVADRVRMGGHAVLEQTIRRRYRAGLQNFFHLYRSLASTWRVYDNSGREPLLAAAGRGRETVTVNSPGVWQRMQREESNGT